MEHPNNCMDSSPDLIPPSQPITRRDVVQRSQEQDLATITNGVFIHPGGRIPIEIVQSQGHASPPREIVPTSPKKSPLRKRMKRQRVILPPEELSDSQTQTDNEELKLNTAKEIIVQSPDESFGQVLEELNLDASVNFVPDTPSTQEKDMAPVTRRDQAKIPAAVALGLRGQNESQVQNGFNIRKRVVQVHRPRIPEETPLGPRTEYESERELGSPELPDTGPEAMSPSPLSADAAAAVTVEMLPPKPITKAARQKIGIEKSTQNLNSTMSSSSSSSVGNQESYEPAAKKKKPAADAPRGRRKRKNGGKWETQSEIGQSRDSKEISETSKSTEKAGRFRRISTMMPSFFPLPLSPSSANSANATVLIDEEYEDINYYNRTTRSKSRSHSNSSSPAKSPAIRKLAAGAKKNIVKNVKNLNEKLEQVAAADKRNTDLTNKNLKRATEDNNFEESGNIDKKNDSDEMPSTSAAASNKGQNLEEQGTENKKLSQGITTEMLEKFENAIMRNSEFEKTAGSSPSPKPFESTPTDDTVHENEINLNLSSNSEDVMPMLNPYTPNHNQSLRVLETRENVENVEDKQINQAAEVIGINAETSRSHKANREATFSTFATADKNPLPYSLIIPTNLQFSQIKAGILAENSKPEDDADLVPQQAEKIEELPVPKAKNRRQKKVGVRRSKKTQSQEESTVAASIIEQSNIGASILDAEAEIEEVPILRKSSRIRKVKGAWTAPEETTENKSRGKKRTAIDATVDESQFEVREPELSIIPPKKGRPKKGQDKSKGKKGNKTLNNNASQLSQESQLLEVALVTEQVESLELDPEKPIKGILRQGKNFSNLNESSNAEVLKRPRLVSIFSPKGFRTDDKNGRLKKGEIGRVYTPWTDRDDLRSAMASQSGKTIVVTPFPPNSETNVPGLKESVSVVPTATVTSGAIEAEASNFHRSLCNSFEEQNKIRKSQHRGSLLNYSEVDFPNVSDDGAKYEQSQRSPSDFFGPVIFEELMFCKKPLDDELLLALSSENSISVLKATLQALKIHTVGDLCSLKRYSIKELPIKGDSKLDKFLEVIKLRKEFYLRESRTDQSQTQNASNPKSQNFVESVETTDPRAYQNFGFTNGINLGNLKTNHVSNEIQLRRFSEVLRPDSPKLYSPNASALAIISSETLNQYGQDVDPFEGNDSMFNQLTSQLSRGSQNQRFELREKLAEVAGQLNALQSPEDIKSVFSLWMNQLAKEKFEIMMEVGLGMSKLSRKGAQN